MRRIVLIILGALLFNSVESFAQNNRRFTIFADPQLSWFTSDTKKFEPNGAVGGFNIGFTADKFFADRYAVFTGLSINNIGGNLKYKDLGYKIETRDATYNVMPESNVKLKAQFLTIPFGLKFKTTEIGYLSFFAHLGVSGSVRLKAVVWEDNNDVDKETITKQYQPAFASYFIGAGVEYSLGGPSSLQTGITYSNGMTETFKAGYGKVSNGSLSLRIGIVF